MLHGAKPQLLSMTSSILGSPVPLRLHHHRWPLLASPSTKPQLLSMTLSHAFKASTIWEILTQY